MGSQNLRLTQVQAFVTSCLVNVPKLLRRPSKITSMSEQEGGKLLIATALQSEYARFFVHLDT